MIFQQPLERIVNAYKVGNQGFLRRIANSINEVAYGIILGLAFVGGCNSKITYHSNPGKSITIIDVEPRGRIGSYATLTLGTNFVGKDLGSHGYRFNLLERNGIVYTCKAGHIDITHSRKVADWTAFLASKTFKNLMKNETRFSFKLKEPSLYFVELTYPENWRELPQKEHIAYDISVKIGQYLAYTTTTWHEILTWFGYKSTGIILEFPSAFSWEDSFSNNFGSYIGALALQDTEHTFDEAVTLALDQELKKLDIQTINIARQAAEKVRGNWFSGDFLFVNMKKRNLDIGIDDGYVTPTIIPTVCECEGAKPQPYPVPNLDFLSEYGFSVKLEIEPRVWESKKILGIVYSDGNGKRIQPKIHFAKIMDFIEKQATEFGYDVTIPFYSDIILVATHPDTKIHNTITGAISQNNLHPLKDLSGNVINLEDLITQPQQQSISQLPGNLDCHNTTHMSDIVLLAENWLKQSQ